MLACLATAVISGRPAANADAYGDGKPQQPGINTALEMRGLLHASDLSASSSPSLEMEMEEEVAHRRSSATPRPPRHPAGGNDDARNGLLPRQ